MINREADSSERQLGAISRGLRSFPHWFLLTRSTLTCDWRTCQSAPEGFQEVSECGPSPTAEKSIPTASISVWSKIRLPSNTIGVLINERKPNEARLSSIPIGFGGSYLESAPHSSVPLISVGCLRAKFSAPPEYACSRIATGKIHHNVFWIEAHYCVV